jgi:3-deoxy-7-phosphoheptulonate synthase
MSAPAEHIIPSASPEPTFSEIDDTRIRKISPIASPALLLEELPASGKVRKHVRQSRKEIDDILCGNDDRVLAIVGPCSIHDLVACEEFARKLVVLAETLKEDVKVVMRVYFEKPRTTVGWKGLINDPELDGTNQIGKGLKMARSFLLLVNELGLAAGTEYLETISPQFFADLIAWGAIGARTTESQVHRQLASGLSCAIGFKNATSGDVQIAVDACLSARESHSFLSVTKDGVAAIVHTTGNPMCHIILRGGTDGPNYGAPAVEKCRKAMQSKKLQPQIIVDCSHANSASTVPPFKKDYKLQTEACDDVARQIAAGETDIKGIMMESHLMEGNQPLVPGSTNICNLKYGTSVTDGCLNFEQTEKSLISLAKAVRARREAQASPAKAVKLG